MGTHEYTDDPRNANVWVSINGELFRRPEAKVSVLDAGFLLGDGVWEAFRLHEDVLVFLDDHLDIPAKSRTSNEKSRQDAGQQGEYSITVEHFFLRQVAAAVAHSEGGRGSV